MSGQLIRCSCHDDGRRSPGYGDGVRIGTRVVVVSSGRQGVVVAELANECEWTCVLPSPTPESATVRTGSFRAGGWVVQFDGERRAFLKPDVRARTVDDENAERADLVFVVAVVVLLLFGVVAIVAGPPRK